MSRKLKRTLIILAIIALVFFAIWLIVKVIFPFLWDIFAHILVLVLCVVGFCLVIDN